MTILLGQQNGDIAIIEETLRKIPGLTCLCAHFQDGRSFVKGCKVLDGKCPMLPDTQPQS